MDFSNIVIIKVAIIKTITIIKAINVFIILVINTQFNFIISYH